MFKAMRNCCLSHKPLSGVIYKLIKFCVTFKTTSLNVLQLQNELM